MSAANASAKKRRATISSSANELPSKIGGKPYSIQQQQQQQIQRTQNTQPQPQPQSGFTLPQVIALIDKRLANLEKSVNDLNNKYTEINNTHTNVSTDLSIPEQGEISDIHEYLDEYNSRFEILTQELSDFKTIILKLQSYTMDVNKMLLEEKQSLTNNVYLQEPLYTIKENEAEEEVEKEEIKLEFNEQVNE